jgi:hypothetical protein
MTSSRTSSRRRRAPGSPAEMIGGSVRITRGRHPRGSRTSHVVFGEGYPTARACQQLAQRRHRRRDMARPEATARSRQGAAAVADAPCVRPRRHVHCNELVPEGSRTSSWPSCRVPVPGVRHFHDTTPAPRGAITTVGRFAPYRIDQLCTAVADYWREAANARSSSSARARFSVASTPEQVAVARHRAQRVRIRRGPDDLLASSAVCVMPYLSGTQSRCRGGADARAPDRV